MRWKASIAAFIKQKNLWTQNKFIWKYTLWGNKEKRIKSLQDLRNSIQRVTFWAIWVKGEEKDEIIERFLEK